PTEAAVSITYWQATGQETNSVPIGVPQWNSRVYVLDSRLQPVPAGVVGELYLAGDQLARGYVTRPDLSSDRFVASPFDAGRRMYRTGDLVRWTHVIGDSPTEGWTESLPVLEYLGRTDFQVKFRGQRIELGEIESALLAQPVVSQAVVTVAASELGEQLVAYVVPAPGEQIVSGVLLESLRDVLPVYMIPAVVMELDAFPLNTSGKLDRKALPAPVFEAREFRAASTPIEEIVAGVFADVLGVERIGADDDFFALGGNSLIATQVAARLSAALDVQVPVRMLFEASTVAALAAAAESATGRGDMPVLAARERPERVPLSLAQQRMWFLNRFDDRSAAYNIPLAVRLTGDLDVDALRAAVSDLVARHEVLRTVYPEVDGIGYQQVLPAGAVDIELDPEPVTEAELPARILQLAGVLFDVVAELPFRVSLLRLDEHNYVLLLVAHHISADGFSPRPLLRDLVVAYNDRSRGVAPAWEPLAVQYADYTLWQREVLGSEDDPESVAAEQIAYWREQLRDMPDRLDLPADRPRPEISSDSGAAHDFVVDIELRTALESLARSHGTTLFMVVHAALAAWASRLSSSSDISIGTPIAGRGEQALDDLVGMFVNTLVLRTEVAPGTPFTELLAEVRRTDLAAFANADIPFERLVDILNPRRSRAHHPLFQVVLAFEAASVADTAAVSLPGLDLGVVDFQTGQSKFDLQLTVGTEGAADGGLRMQWAYATDLFDPETVAGFSDRFLRILRAIVREPATAVGDIDLLTGTERLDVTQRWAQSRADARPGVFSVDGVALDDPETATLAGLFEAAAGEHPHRTAAKYEGDQLTYAELERRANVLARRLIDEGAGPEARVAVLLPRSLDLVVALLAVIKSGAAYVPVDPDSPADRIAYILQDARPATVVLDSSVRVDLPGGVSRVVVDGYAVEAGDIEDADDGPVTDADRLAPLRPDNTAYVIYTSGSTGRPKGVAVAHRSVVRLFANTEREFGFGPEDVWTLFHSYAFDFSVWELWGPLLFGGTLVVVDYYTSRSPQQFLELLRTERVTVLNQTPSAFYQLAEADRTAQAERPLALRYVVFGGEALELRRLSDWIARHGDGSTGRTVQIGDRETASPVLVNMYGITETTVHVAHRALDAETIAEATGSVIGRAIAGLKIYVLDSRLRPVPVGVTGELYIAGGQLAHGYLDRPDLTAARFVADPLAEPGAPGARLYRSGDLARWNRSGELEYLGRADDQVKVRGFRIELGEIEAAVLAHPDVAQAAVIVREDTPGDHRIVAYVVSETEDEPDTEAIRDGVGQRVPSYMVPSAVVVLDRIPLTINGKLDRRALPAPVFESGGSRAASTPIEEIVAGVFAEVLGTERVGADDDFFALGGNSLIATQVAARIGAALDTQVPVRMLFEDSTVAALAARVEQQAGAGGRPVLAARPRPERPPLSQAQQRIWFLNRFEPESAVDNIPLVLRLTGTVDMTVLLQAVSDVIARHESLRTVYPAHEGIGYQQVLPPDRAVPEVEILETHRAAVSGAELTGDLLASIAEFGFRGFDLTTELPVRLRVYRLTEDDYVLAGVVHHIAADGFSMRPLSRDLMIAYSARSAGAAPDWEPMTVQYIDYAMWQREVLGSDEDPASLVSQQLDFWRAELDELPDELRLSSRPRPAVASERAATHRFVVPGAVIDELNRVAQAQGVTLFMLVHSTFATLLARLSGTDDIAIGIPVAGRGERVLDELIGMFVNTLVLRTRVDIGAPFAELLAHVRDRDLAAFAHADVPFERLVEALNPVRSQSRQPLFQVMLAFQNLGDTRLELPGLTMTGFDVEIPNTKYDLSLTMSDAVAGGSGMDAEILYATDLFDDDFISEFGRRFVRVLRAVIADATVPVGDIELMAPAERALVLDRWNATGFPVETALTETPGNATATLVSLFEAQVARTPDEIALTFEGTNLSYAEFAGRVHRLARRLVGMGVGPEVYVALGMQRSFDLVVGMYAVVVAGGAYIPLDPEQPVERLGHILDTARPVCVLTSGADLDPVIERQLRIDRLDLSEYSDAPLTDADRLQPLRSANTAYVIFTSGSTGRPKGVAVAHKAIVNYLVAAHARYGMSASDVMLQRGTVTFDASVPEFFLPLQVGARLVIARPDGHRDPAYLAGIIASEGVTTVQFVPSMLSVIMADTGPDAWSSVRHIVVGGETLPVDLPRRLRKLTNARLDNLYGPTEATVDLIFHEVTEADTESVPIGVPAFNTQAYVLDGRLRPVPPGVPGELYVAGAQLARGYVERADLTFDRFVANPFGAGVRMYRTGDLARWNFDGELEYLGRTDFQVKLRGLRIELGEIEAALLGVDEIAQVVVVMRADEHTGDQLVAYLVPETGRAIDPEAVRSALRAELPAYMVPAAFVVLDAFPMNAAGKLDRKALPAPVFEARVFRAPSTPIEEVVASTFAEVLGLERVGADDDFFELGGNSLVATQVAARIGAALDTQVTVRALFEAPTVAALAVRVEQAGEKARPALVAGPRPDLVPLSYAQQRMWFLNQFDTSSVAYNLPMAIRLSGELDVAALRAALADVLRRHESLRTYFPERSGVPVQLVVPADRVDLRLETVAVTADELPAAVAEFVGIGFDVSVAPPLRARLLEVTPREFVLVVVVHHISGDGFSMAPLARDVMTAYAARVRDLEPGWNQLPVQYADYTLWQRQVLGAEDDVNSPLARQIAFWQRTLDGVPDELALPTDRSRPAVASMRGATVSGELSAELIQGLDGVARGRGASMFMALHAGLAALLARLSGSDDIAIGTPIAGRGERALDDLVGMFVNTLVLRTNVGSGESFAALVDRARQVDLDAFGNADVPFERLVDLLAPERSQARNPLFQVALSLQNNEQPVLDLAGLEVSGLDLVEDVARFDLQFTLAENGSGGMTLFLNYATELFDEATIRTVITRFRQLLTAVVTDPHIALGSIEILDEAERAEILSRTGGAAVPASTLPELLAAAVAVDPSAPAVVFRDQRLSYGEMDERSNRLAHVLIEYCLGAEDLVAVAVPRSADSVLAEWAVAKSGAAFLPIDPTYPADRIAHMLTDSGAAVGITVSSVRADLPDSVDWLVLDELALDTYPADPITDADRVWPLTPANTAYVIYTSGSTGLPKGVVVSHAGLANFSAEQVERYRLTPDSRALAFASPSFDASILELLLAVGSAGALVVVPTGTYGGTELGELISREGVTVGLITPSVLASLDPADLAGMEVIIAGGEAISADLMAKWSTTPEGGVARRFHNAYGPTEATVATNISGVLHAGDRVTIGGPVRGMRTLVLDDRMNPVPEGVAGELYVGGIQLARGYHARPGLTAERFVADPYGEPGSRLYRTGDVVRWRRDTAGDPAVEYVGRNDFQVKVRGFRIELGEIDAALTAHETVDFAVTTGHESAAGVVSLVSYVVAVPGRSIDVAEVREFVGQRLPSYMVPASVMVLDEVPLTPAGKLDRRALPEPAFEARKFRAPSTPVERVVAGVLADVLGIERVGADDDFFALGGNSLLATQVVARLGAALNTQVPVRLLFEASVVGTLAARLEEQVGSGGRPALVPQPRPTRVLPSGEVVDRIPLSLAQQRMWFLNWFDGGAAAYNIPLVIRLSGALDVDALRLAVTDLVARHEVLRTVYPETESGPAQVVLPVTGAVPVLEMRTVAADAVETVVTELASVSFDVAQQVPVQVTLLRIDDAADEYVLAAVVHHISGDGASTVPLMRDLMTAYSARAAGRAPDWAPLAVQYADFAIWQRNLMGDGADPSSLAHEQLDFWRSALADLPEQLDLPMDRPRPATQAYDGGRVEVHIDARLHQALQDFARQQGVTLFMVTHTAFALLLARLAGTDDVAIGTPVAGRGEAALDDVIGMFVNTLVFRTRVEGGESFTDLLARQREIDIAALAHADVPFEQLVEALNPVRSTARHPLFQVGFAFQNLAQTSLEIPGLSVSGVDAGTEVSLYDLSMILSDTYDASGAAAGVSGYLTYATALFDHATVAGFVQRYLRVLAGIVADPAAPVGELELLDTAERELVLHRWNATDRIVEPGLLLDGFDRVVSESPDRVALTYEGTGLSYGEFAVRVRRLARWLRDAGVGTETYVALGMRRSIDLITGAYAVVAAGGAYVPLDPDQPVDRLEYIVDTARPICVLTSGEDLDPAIAGQVRIDRLDLSGVAGTALTDADRLRPLRPDNTAYAIFTSGSTGRPKGVPVSHRAVLNYLATTRERHELGAGDVLLNRTLATFDPSVVEFFMPLQLGARLVIAHAEGHRDAAYLTGLIADEGVTMAQFVPSLLSVFLSESEPSAWAGLRSITVGGEALSGDLARRLRERTGARLFNQYGPTETTVDVTAHEVTGVETGAVPIGVPGLNTRTYVLDDRLRPAPAGVQGELYISGAQLAPGYLARPDLTTTRFVADPFHAGERMYRTGDLVRWTAAGELEYLGRSDFQVKLHGQRIEPGEIEAALTEMDAVARALVILRHAGTGDHLVAYVVPVAGATITTDELRAHLHGRLPSYMVPSAFVALETFPMNASGKLDRNALPEPVFETREFRAASTPIEEILADIFAEVLGVERVGADDDFFALGGDSIVSIQLVSRAKSRGVVFTPRQVFEKRTVSGLASVAEFAEFVDGAVRTLAELPGGGVGRMPLTPVVRTMVERFGSFGRFHQLTPLSLPIGVTRETIAAVVGPVLDRHDMLRSRLFVVDGEWAVETVEPGSVDVDALIDHTVFDAAATDEQVLETATAAVDAALDRMDPGHGVVVRFVWLEPDTADRPGYLVVVAHHLVVDGVSWRILVPDFVLSAGAHSAGLLPELPEPTTSMRTWAHALETHARSAEREAELDYWRTVVDTADPLLTDRALDPAVDTAATVDTYSVRVSPEVTQALLTTVPALFHGGVNDGLLTALVLATATWRARRVPSAAIDDPLLVRLEGHGREEEVVPGADLSHTVGWFTSVFPVRFAPAGIDFEDALAGGPALGAALKAVKEQLLAVPDKGIGYGLLRHLNPRTASELPVELPGQVSFNYLGRSAGSGELSPEMREFGWLPADLVVDAAFDADMPALALLDINAVVAGDEFIARIGYPTTLLGAEEVREFGELWTRALEAVARHANSAGAGGHTPSDFGMVALSQSDVDGIERRFPVADVWPLSALQAGMLFHAQIAETSVDVYTGQVVLTLTGRVDAARLRAAAQALVDRYENLRTAFVTDHEGHPVQVVLKDMPVDWTEHDRSRAGTAADLIEADRLRRFDLAEPPLLRFTLIKTGADTWQFVVANHHILLDGWSMPLLMRDLLTLYAVRGDAAVLPAVHSYRTFLAWVGRQDRGVSLETWRAALAGVEEPTLLVRPEAGGSEITTLSGEYEFGLDTAATARMTALATEVGVTANTVLQLAWAVLLGRLTGRDDVLFGATVSGRPPELPGVETMVGLFINTIPVRVRFDQNEPVRTVLARVQAEQADLLDHHYVGLADIQGAAGMAALFDTLLVFESYPVDAAGIQAQASDIDGMTVAGLAGIDATHYPLTLVAALGNTLRIRAGYRRDMFDEADVRRIADRLVRLLDGIVADPSVAVGDIDLLAPAERELVLERWNATHHAVDARLLPDEFAAAVARYPDRVAVSFEGAELTYAEFAGRVNRLARLLIAEGVGPESLVGLALRRSVDLVVAMYAVVTAGGAYVPVDPEHPAERTAYVLETARPVCVLTSTSDAGAVPEGTGVPVLALDTLELSGYADAPVTDADRRAPLRPSNTAYVIFTSGSTGRPKGVAVSHAAIVNRLVWMQSEYGLTASDVVLQKTPSTFDVSVWEFFWPLQVGARLVVA
ncbi:non-ribosomal peptide synthase/polyketide synthase, partial [Nocardia rhamnosiphila]